MRKGPVDLPTGFAWIEGGARKVLDIGRSVVVDHRAPARYLGHVMPGSASSPERSRPILRFRLTAKIPALYNDTVPVLLLPGQIVEVQ